jgi:hypothetical protein
MPASLRLKSTMKRLMILASALSIGYAANCAAGDLSKVESECAPYIKSSADIKITGKLNGIRDPNFKYDGLYAEAFASGRAVSATTAARLYSVQFLYFSENNATSVHDDPIILNHVKKVECGTQRYLKKDGVTVTGCIPADCFFQLNDKQDGVEDISISTAYNDINETPELVARRQGACILTALAIASGKFGVWNQNLNDDIEIVSGSMGPEWFVRPGSLFETCVFYMKRGTH